VNAGEFPQFIGAMPKNDTFPKFVFFLRLAMAAVQQPALICDLPEFATCLILITY